MEERELLHLNVQDIISKKGLLGSHYYVVLEVSGNKFKLAKLVRAAPVSRKELEEKHWDKTTFAQAKARLK